jgi:hypothetical protein
MGCAAEAHDRQGQDKTGQHNIKSGLSSQVASRKSQVEKTQNITVIVIIVAGTLLNSLRKRTCKRKP